MIIIEPEIPPTHCVIWLHGLGADGHDFEPLAMQIGNYGGHAVRHMLPDAPIKAVSINMGMRMHAWYDIYSQNLEVRVDRPGILDACHAIEQLIDEQITQGIAADKIVLIGFSQGGVIAMQIARQTPLKLGGVAALSAYMALPEVDIDRDHADTPILIAHGRMDDIVPYARGEAARDHLLAQNYRVSWHTYAMGHSVCAEEIKDIQRWLNQI